MKSQLACRGPRGHRHDANKCSNEIIASEHEYPVPLTVEMKKGRLPPPAFSASHSDLNELGMRTASIFCKWFKLFEIRSGKYISFACERENGKVLISLQSGTCD
jgi:hypothetical protein